MHDGSFGSGRFCCSDCAKKYSLSFSKGKKPEDKSTKEEKVEESVKIAPPKKCTAESSKFDGKLTTELLGYVGECATIFQLARAGIMSSKPCGVGKYDVIADIKGVLYKIQVKSTAGYIDENGELSFSLQNKSGLYKKGEVDFFALYSYIHNIVLLIPFDMLEGKSKVYIHFGKTKDESDLFFWKDHILFDVVMKSLLSS